MPAESENDGLTRVRSELQQLITFRRLNLLDEEWGLQQKYREAGNAASGRTGQC